MRRRRDRLLLSCEHAHPDVPRRLAAAFRGRRRLLASHRGYDAGALALARALRRRTGASLLEARWSRLVVDPNRSPGHPGVFSEVTRALPRTERDALLSAWHRPHREAVERAARRLGARARVVHVAVHSFTPTLDGRPRDVDVGLLYDPRRAGERGLCAAWAAQLRSRAPELRVRRNAPYRGVSDGLTTHLRGRLPAGSYLGIELEVSQRLLRREGASARLGRLFAASLEEILR